MLKYVGNGAFVPGIPARDLSDEEVERFGEKMLLATKLYVHDRAEKVQGEQKPQKRKRRRE